MNKKEVNSARMPIYRDAGFELFDSAATESAFKNETKHERDPDHFIYSRYRNPTVVSAEEEIMKLEQCSWALLTQTGMSAIDTATSVFHKGKDTKPWIFFSEIYGGTISFRIRRDKFISLVSDKIKLIPTLGDPHTILMPVEAVWGAKYPEPGMIRLSVGFEEYEELQETISRALTAFDNS